LAWKVTHDARCLEVAIVDDDVSVLEQCRRKTVRMVKSKTKVSGGFRTLKGVQTWTSNVA
jgi:hypothetical protein